MSTTKQRLPIRVAAPLALKIRQSLATSCQRLEIVGSVRRFAGSRFASKTSAATVGDIELLAIPDRFADLLGEPADETLLDLKLGALIRAGKLKRGPRQGAHWKTLALGAWPGVMLELFVADEASWGVQMAVRTGPDRFARGLMTERRRGGLLPDGHAVALGWRVWRREDIVTAGIDGPVSYAREGATPIAFDSEEAFIRWCVGDWLEPGERDDFPIGGRR